MKIISSMMKEDFVEDDVDMKMIPDQILLSPNQHHLDPISHETTNTNKCQTNKTYIWCLPLDYNQEKHPFTCKILRSTQK